MKRKEDTYQMWERTGVLKSKLDYIKAASATFYTQKDMCRDLDISEKTFISLKNKHPEIQQAISDGEAILLKDLFSALKLKAMGHKEKTTSKTMRKNPIGGTETKVTEDEKYYPPDFEVIKYILIMKFGTVFLKLLIDEAKRIGIKEILLTVEKSNPTSRHIIEKNGGLLIDENDDRWFFTFK